MTRPVIESRDMIPYAEREVFTLNDVAIWKKATLLVRAISAPVDFEVRCHELARAVQRYFPQSAKVIDGHYSRVEHSWLQLSANYQHSRVVTSILDVYAVGRLPMVQLQDISTLVMRAHLNEYQEGPERTDINDEHVNRLYKLMQVDQVHLIHV